MDQFPQAIRAVRHFFTRDLTYILGGTVVIASLIYGLNCLDVRPRFHLNQLTDLPLILLLLLLAFAHALGYLVQDLASFRIVTTALVFNPRRCLTRLFHSFQREPWPIRLRRRRRPDRTRYPSSWTMLAAISHHAHERQKAEIDRLIHLLGICATMTPCTLLAATFLAIRAFITRNIFDGILAATAIVIGLGFFALCWLKAAQQTQVMCQFFDDLPPPHAHVETPPQTTELLEILITAIKDNLEPSQHHVVDTALSEVRQQYLSE